LQAIAYLFIILGSSTPGPWRKSMFLCGKERPAVILDDTASPVRALAPFWGKVGRGILRKPAAG
jgi:hypothetical protein